MKKLISAFVVGLVFGLGLTVSEMINPAKVLSFLDLFGNWDPSLILVMGGALVVTALGYRFAWQREKPILADRFEVPKRTDLDKRLLGGAVLFGIGWGLVGYCPGPAITAIGLGHPKTLAFVAAMIGGMLIYELFDRTVSSRQAGRREGGLPGAGIN